MTLTTIVLLSFICFLVLFKQNQVASWVIFPSYEDKLKQLQSEDEVYFTYKMNQNNVQTKASLLKVASPLTISNLTVQVSLGSQNLDVLPGSNSVHVLSALVYKGRGQSDATLIDAFNGAPNGPSTGTDLDFTQINAPVTQVGGIAQNVSPMFVIATQACQLKGIEDVQNACQLTYDSTFDPVNWDSRLNLDSGSEIYLISKFQKTDATIAYDGLMVTGSMKYTTQHV